MSSILDALNKLEQEKAQASRETERADTDPMMIANELVGRSVLRDRVTLRVTPAALFASIGALVVALIVLTLVAVLIFTRPKSETPPASASIAAAPGPVSVDTPASTVTSPPPNTESAPVVVPPIAESKPENLPEPAAIAPAETSLSKAVPEVTSAPAVETPKSTDAAAPPPAPASEPPATKVEKKASPPVAKAPPVKSDPAPDSGAEEVSNPETKTPAATSRPRTRVAARPPDSEDLSARDVPGARRSSERNEDINLESLPILSPMEQSRHGFLRLKVNLVKPAGDTNPQGSAIITLEEEADGGERIVNRTKY